MVLCAFSEGRKRSGPPVRRQGRALALRKSCSGRRGGHRHERVSLNAFASAGIGKPVKFETIAAAMAGRSYVHSPVVSHANARNGRRGRAASAPAASSADGTDGTRRQHAVSRHDLRRGHARPAAAVRLDPESEHSRRRLVGLRASAARRLGRAVRHVRLGVRRDLDRSRQRRAVHRLRRDLDRRAGVRRPRAAADVSGRRRGAVAARLPHAVLRQLDGRARSCSRSGIITAYTWATAYEFWRGRSEPLVSRWPAIFMLFAHGALFLLRTPLSQVLPWSPTNQVFDSVWLTVLSFEALLFTIAIAFILLAMAKERTELRHKTAALVDPLTGIANRRAFLEEVMALEQAPGGGRPRPAAVLLADLDHFKSINDRFGHAVGDHVLQIFAETASAKLGPYDLIGRLGGEEFAIVLYDAGRDKGARHRRAHPAGVRDRRGRGRRPSDRRHRQHGHGRSPRRACSTSRRCWRRPTRRSIAPRSAAATASRSPRSSSCSTAPGKPSSAIPGRRSAPAAAPARPSAAHSWFLPSSLLLGGGFDLFLHSHQLAVQLLHCRFERGNFRPGGGEIAV